MNEAKRTFLRFLATWIYAGDARVLKSVRPGYPNFTGRTVFYAHFSNSTYPIDESGAEEFAAELCQALEAYNASTR